ncbi:hypothetical protein [Sanguibacter suaedae]|uniref:Serine protease n=1 Tax=Sanguibacter suaedae TaxID=2795737 RepID=A0A934IBV6_9MICO|nr:hypothetical protein [Sanguibacter suaedae]MBI9115820.1 hypothetical protein [Sanguibacter suaedae]
MDHEQARQTKTEVTSYVEELLARSVRASGAPDGSTRGSGIAVGLAPLPDGGYGIALRYQLGFPTARMVARRVVHQVGPGVDVRRTGRIRVGPQGARTGQVVATAQAVGETGRARPLRPGVSIAHVDVTAGTLGAFVRVDGQVQALSNYHVLVGGPTGRTGDTILQPGPADGGLDPHDRVGTLGRFVALERGEVARVDAALAVLDDEVVDLDHPVGRVTRAVDVLGGEQVAKIGRTTGLTTGRVTAIELDDVVVDYGEGLGALRFDDQIEVEGAGPGPFSRGGDSGSLVYRADGVAVGLLFAGSESGGDNGTGLTYINPIGTVLDALGAQLVD